MRSLFLALALAATAGAQTPAPAARPVTIGNLDSLWSPTLKEYRRFLVYTPPSYRQTVYQPRAYPVLYLLDGDAHFHSVTGLLQILGTGVNGTFVVPEMIVIAIPNTNRTRDLTPTRATTTPDGKQNAGFAISGGGPAFLQFMKSELIPYVDSTFRTEPYRVLVGHSFGGITAISALYTMPDEFRAYVAIDPSMWWDNQTLLKQAPDFFAKTSLAQRALYLGQANTKSTVDTTPNAHFNAISEFNRVLRASAAKSGMRYGFKYYPDDDHGSVPMIAEYDALRFIFDGYRLDREKALAETGYITQHYTTLSTRLGYTVSPPERIVDQLGLAALATDTVKAVSLLQLNTTLYPKSAHAFQVLGSALLASRDSARARSAYERAAELAPDDQRLRDVLQRLGRK